MQALDEPVPERVLPALEEHRGDIGQLSEFPGNPRRHDLPAIAEVYRAFGQVQPLLVNTGTKTGRGREMIAGHGQLEVMRRHGWTRPAWVEGDWDDGEARRLLAGMNGASRNAVTDADALAEFLLPTLDDLTGSSYDIEELAEALRRRDDDIAGDPGLAGDPDEAPGVVAEDAPTVSALGDVIVMGRHRLVVGDSRDEDTWNRLLGTGPDAELLDAVWTDPPYGVAIVGGSHALSPAERRARGGKEIVGDQMSPAELGVFLREIVDAGLARCRAGAVWYVAAPSGPLTLATANALHDTDVWHQTLVWVKNSLVMGRSDYQQRHEFVFYGWKPGAAHHAPPDRKQTTVFEIDRPSRSKDHPTMKPVRLVADQLANSTEPGDRVGDLCSGSGTTMIACHQLGRSARLIELDPRYADVIARRWQDRTGQWPHINGEPVDIASHPHGPPATSEARQDGTEPREQA